MSSIMTKLQTKNKTTGIMQKWLQLSLVALCGDFCIWNLENAFNVFGSLCGGGSMVFVQVQERNGKVDQLNDWLKSPF